MATGLEQTLALLTSHKDAALAAAVLADGLNEPEIAPHAVASLCANNDARSARELLRHYHNLSPTARVEVCRSQARRLLGAAHQLLGSDRAQSRQNIAMAALDLLTNSDLRWSELLSTWLVLVDDPAPPVRDAARETFLAALKTHGHSATTIGPRDPTLQTLSILLRGFESHGDARVLAALFERGVAGADLLARAIGENWPVAPRLKSAFDLMVKSDTADTRALVDGLFRWLNCPYPLSRECARNLLRSGRSPLFLEACVARLRTAAAVGREQDYPVLRNVRWDLLSVTELRALDAPTLLRIASYVQAASYSAEERALRLAHLLQATTDPAVLKDLLHFLRELPTAQVVAHFEPLLGIAEEELQRLVTELLSVDAGRDALRCLMRQLCSGFASVRSAAQRKLSGQSLELLFSSFDGLTSAERRQLVPILEKIDVHFAGQLRRALRSTIEQETVRALRIVIDSQRVPDVEESLFDLTVSPSARVRATLARTFESTSREPALHYLRLYLGDPDTRVIANSVETLGRVGDRRAASWLEPLRTHATPRVRVNALVALARLGEQHAVAELVALAGSAATTELAMSAHWGIAELRRTA
ncbi:MAG: HEAT repeat domain-containing protein [Planctomycetota bacterium]